MSIFQPDSRVTYSADGSVKDFVIPFPFAAPDDVEVSLDGSLVRNYVIVGSVLTFLDAPKGEVRFRRLTEITQLRTLQDPLARADLVDSWDKLTLIMQDLSARAGEPGTVLPAEPPPVDTSPPAQPVVTQPASPTSALSIPVSGTCDLTTGSVSVFVNGSLWASITPSNGHWFVNLTGVLEGSNVVTAVAFNGNGASPTSAPRTLVVDRSAHPPGVPAITPITTPTAALQIAVFGTCDAFTTSIELLVDGTNTVTVPVTTSPWGTLLSGIADGSHFVQARAVNQYGHSGYTVATNFTVDRTVKTPTAPWVNALGSPTSATSIPVTGTCDSKATSITVYVDGAYSTIVSPSSGAWNATLIGLAEGTHTVQAMASNSFGPSPLSNTQTVVVQLSPFAAPTITFPATGRTFAPPLTMTGIDAEPGLPVEIWLNGTYFATSDPAGVDGGWAYEFSSPPVGLASVKVRVLPGSTGSLFSDSIGITFSDPAYALVVPGASIAMTLQTKVRNYGRKYSVNAQGNAVLFQANLGWWGVIGTDMEPADNASWSDFWWNSLRNKARTFPGSAAHCASGYMYPTGPINSEANPYDVNEWGWSTTGGVPNEELCGEVCRGYAERAVAYAVAGDDADLVAHPWGSYRAEFDLAEGMADAFPRDAQGRSRIQSDWLPHGDAGTWDTIQIQVPPGGGPWSSCIGTFYLCWVYKKLMEAATIKGDSVDLARVTTKYNAAEAALRLFRQSDGFYDSWSIESWNSAHLENVYLTARIVEQGFCSGAERAASAAALYTAMTTPGARNTYRGYIRLLKYPLGWFGPPGHFVDGAYWPGWYTLAVTNSLLAHSKPAAEDLFTNYCREIMRQERSFGTGPWECLQDPTDPLGYTDPVERNKPNSLAYHGYEWQGWMGMADTPVEGLSDPFEFVFFDAVAGQDYILPAPSGHIIDHVRVTSSVAVTAVVELWAQHEQNHDGEPIGSNDGYGPEFLIGRVALNASVDSGSVYVPLHTYLGGRLRAKIVSLSVEGVTLTVQGIQTATVAPVFTAGKVATLLTKTIPAEPMYYDGTQDFSIIGGTADRWDTNHLHLTGAGMVFALLPGTYAGVSAVVGIDAAGGVVFGYQDANNWQALLIDRAGATATLRECYDSVTTDIVHSIPAYTNRIWFMIGAFGGVVRVTAMSNLGSAQGYADQIESCAPFPLKRKPIGQVGWCANQNGWLASGFNFYGLPTDLKSIPMGYLLDSWDKTWQPLSPWSVIASYEGYIAQFMGNATWKLRDARGNEVAVGPTGSWPVY